MKGDGRSDERTRDGGTMESGAQSICDPVRGSGAGMNISYTFNLTPPTSDLRLLIFAMLDSMEKKADAFCRPSF